VYAVDISRELVDYIASRSREEHLPQLATVESTVATIPLPSGIADVVLLATVLHDISASTVAEAVRLLRPSGRLIDLDWKKVDEPVGPPLTIRLSPAEATVLLAHHGLHVVDSWDPGPAHYALALSRAPTKRASEP
jgi:SAM-dependent methyltransferase